MEGKDVFANLKQAFEEAVQYAIEHGISERQVIENEIRRSELLQVVVNEASRRLKEKNVPYQEPTINNEFEHDYPYLQSILSNYDIGRLKDAIALNKQIIVEGVQGPTGKSTFVRYLRERGVPVVEYGLAEVFMLNEFLKEPATKPFKSSVSNGR